MSRMGLGLGYIGGGICDLNAVLRREIAPHRLDLGGIAEAIEQNRATLGCEGLRYSMATPLVELVTSATLPLSTGLHSLLPAAMQWV